MELNRDDIIKALECGARQNCDGCPLYDALGDSDGACLDIMPPNILSLIKELTEENERLKSVEFTCGFIKPHKVLECPIFDEIEKAKADTVRKMQERLKAEIAKYTLDSFQLFANSFIDQIVKEMLEGNNDNT